MITRRDFLKSAIVVAAGLLLGVRPGAAQEQKPEESEADKVLGDGEWHRSVFYYEGDCCIWMNIDDQWYDPDGDQISDDQVGFIELSGNLDSLPHFGTGWIRAYNAL